MLSHHHLDVDIEPGLAWEGDPWLRISVLDDGVGMAPELRAQGFDLFFQGKRSIDRAEGGLGIGLPVLDGYELARRMRMLLDGHPCRLVALAASNPGIAGASPS